MTATTNKNLELPARGSLSGTWDTPVNDNMSIIDNSFGGTATVALTNSNVTLVSAQYQCACIVFTGTISANIAITFPYVGSLYTIENRTAGTFTVTLQTTNTSAEAICCPPYEPFDILTRASTAGVRYRNFGRVGDTWEYMGSSVPLWVAGCTIPPYLNCDGTAFSSATYPALATILSTTVTPDSRGRFKATLNQGQSRITTSGSSVNGNTNFSAGGSEYSQLHTHTAISPVTTITNGAGTNTIAPQAGGTDTQALLGSGANFKLSSEFVTQVVPAMTITSCSAGTGGSQNIPPAYIGGLTLVRAM